MAVAAAAVAATATTACLFFLINILLSESCFQHYWK
jgi:hypothetical protein